MDFAGNVLLFALVATVVGVLVGSFVNVVILRLPERLKWTWRRDSEEFLGDLDGIDVSVAGYAKLPAKAPGIALDRSRCPKCGHQIRAWENIPVISYILLRGKCAGCGKPISLQYPAVELLTAVLSGVVAWQFGFGAAGLAAIALTWTLVAASGIDFREQLLPDVITLPLLWAGLLLNTQGVFTDLPSAVIGAAAGYLSLWLVYHGFKLATGKEGMGHGDFKLLAALGAWMGWQKLPLIILLSALAGAVIGVALIVIRGRDRNIPMPFGPFLAIAGWIALLWGDQIISRYMGVSGL